MFSSNHCENAMVSMLLVTAMRYLYTCDDAVSHLLQHVVTMPYNLSCVPAAEQEPTSVTA